ncbi:hypothetical protein [Natrinema salifodinae]|nr:hypothetical protein [Natrinema salifodinae]
MKHRGDAHPDAFAAYDYQDTRPMHLHHPKRDHERASDATAPVGDRPVDRNGERTRRGASVNRIRSSRRPKRGYKPRFASRSPKR